MKISLFTNEPQTAIIPNMKVDSLFEIHMRSELPSTHEWLKNNLQTKDPCLVVAHEQTQGIGRQGRKWLSPRGGLYASLRFPLEICPKMQKHLGQIPQFLAVCVCEYFSSLNIQIKWPNDLFYQQKKVGGILTEILSTPEGKVMILSLGLNVATAPEDLDPTVASSLSLDLDPKQTAVSVFHFFFQRLVSIDDDLTSFLQKKMVELVIHQIGDPIQIRQGSHIIQGSYSGIDSQGQLQLTSQDQLVSVGFGEVVNL